MQPLCAFVMLGMIESEMLPLLSHSKDKPRKDAMPASELPGLTRNSNAYGRIIFRSYVGRFYRKAVLREPLFTP
jgi:hypothetical protein